MRQILIRHILHPAEGVKRYLAQLRRDTPLIFCIFGVSAAPDLPAAHNTQQEAFRQIIPGQTVQTCPLPADKELSVVSSSPDTLQALPAFPAPAAQQTSQGIWGQSIFPASPGRNTALTAVQTMN